MSLSFFLFFFFHKHGRKPHFSPPPPPRLPGATIINLFLSAFPLKTGKKGFLREEECPVVRRCGGSKDLQSGLRGGNKGGKLFFCSSWLFVVVLHLRRRRNGTFFSEDAAGNSYYTQLPGKGPSFSAANKNRLCSMTCGGDETLVTKL